jgi:SEC-C motif domain protein
MRACPCDSMMPFQLCCGPLISGEKQPPTALALMRSRYTAYAEGDAGYLLRTYADESRARVDLRAIQAGMDGVEWTGLEIVSVRDGQASHSQGQVEFLAHYSKGGELLTVHERSRFVREEGLWRYLDGA